MSTRDKHSALDVDTRKAVVAEACGGHPEDVLIALNAAADALNWIEELFRVIEESALDERWRFRMRTLAAAGAHLAAEFANDADVVHERLRDGLIASGCIPASNQTGQ